MSPALQDAVNKATDEIGEGIPYIAVTCRFQQLLGDFEEGGYETLTETAQESLMEDAAHEIEHIYRKQKKRYPILLTSDSVRFLEYVSRKASYVHIISGRMVHMDYSNAPDIALHLKSFTDLMMLSRAERIYLLKSPKMYNSGFPRVAALIGNKPFSLIRFNY